MYNIFGIGKTEESVNVTPVQFKGKTSLFCYFDRPKGGLLCDCESILEYSDRPKGGLLCD